jgi:hypothetical protein
MEFLCEQWSFRHLQFLFYEKPLIITYVYSNVVYELYFGRGDLTHPCFNSDITIYERSARTVKHTPIRYTGSTTAPLYICFVPSWSYGPWVN